MKHCHCCISYLGQSTLTYTVKTEDLKHSWFTLLMRFFIHTAHNSVLPLLFLKSVSIWSGCPVINIRRCHEDMKLSWIGPICISSTYKVSLLQTSYLSLMSMAALTVFQAWILVYTQKYARLWKYLSSYRKLVDLCVWILFIWYQKLKVSCMVVFRDEGTFGPTTEILNKGSKSNPLTWEVMWILPF